jgi:hypothetical protein
MKRTAHFHVVFTDRNGDTATTRTTVEDAGFLSASALRRQAIANVRGRGVTRGNSTVSAVRVFPPERQPEPRRYYTASDPAPTVGDRITQLSSELLDPDYDPSA